MIRYNYSSHLIRKKYSILSIFFASNHMIDLEIVRAELKQVKAFPVLRENILNAGFRCQTIVQL